jgi:hypothetical protein
MEDPVLIRGWLAYVGFKTHATAFAKKTGRLRANALCRHFLFPRTERYLDT